MELTGRINWDVFKDEIKLDPSHYDMKEAVEHGINEAMLNPGSKVYYQPSGKVRIDVSSVISTSTPEPTPEPTIFSNTFFAPIYTTKLFDNAPIHAMSDQFVANLVSQKTPSTTENAGQVKATPYINWNEYSSAIYHVTKDIPLKKIKLIYTDGRTKTGDLHDRLQQGLRIPDEAIGSGGYDKHIVVYDWVGDVYIELYRYEKDAQTAVYGGVIENASQSNGVFPQTWGAMATGIPMIATMLRHADLIAKECKHPLGLAVPYGSTEWVAPATRTDTNSSPRDSRPESLRAGQWLRLPADYVIDPSLSLGHRILRQAAKDYGIIIVDSARCITFRAEYHPDVPTLLGAPRWKIAQKFPYHKLKALA